MAAPAYELDATQAPTERAPRRRARTAQAPCGLGEGDCDKDDDCEGFLVCSQNAHTGPYAPRFSDGTPVSGADALEDHWLGRRVTAAGRGLTETDERVVTEPISGLTEAAITIDGAGRGGACFGDSGGPLLARDAEGSIRIA